MAGIGAAVLFVTPAESAPKDAAQYQALIDKIVADLGARVGRALSFRPDVVFEPKPAANPLTQGEAMRHYDVTGKHTGCTIHLYPPGRVHPLDSKALKSVLAHELWHCFQADRLDKDAFFARKPWIMEGQAMWVGEAYVNGAPELEPTSRRWRQYVTDPAKPLFTREHDAIGFFAHLDDMGINVWTLLDKVLDAGDDSARAFKVAAPSGAIIASWGASWFLDPGLEPEFDMGKSPGRAAADRPPAPKKITLGAGTTGTLTTPKVTAALAELSVTTDVLRVQLAGYGAIGDRSGHKVYLFEGETRSFCVKSPCKCPDGTTPLADLAPLGRSSHLAVTGGAELSSTARLTGLSLAELCTTKPVTARPPARMK